MNKIKLYWSIISPTLKIMSIGVVVFFVIGVALSIPLCLVWNWLMPTIFDLPTINVLEAFGLSILVTLLSPRKIDLSKKEDTQNVSDGDLNDKLEKVLKDITSEFTA